MGKPENKTKPGNLSKLGNMSKLGSKVGTIALVVALLGLLAAAIWLAVHTWLSAEGPAMSTSAYVAMILGVVFSVVLGCGLMALVFYSSRYGYDEASYDAVPTPRDKDQHSDQHSGTPAQR
jgi:Kef-type K+ transport system membrane component KefB